jgi:predicted acyltransferase
MKQRYPALDTFRGATVALMILVNNPGSWAYIYPPIEHANWHGCTPTDLVFPFFLFAVGNAMSFVMPSFYSGTTANFYKKIIKRSVLIFIIGLLLNWAPFLMYKNDLITFKPWQWINDKGDLVGIRIMGVLQRIAICYAIASMVVFHFKTKGAFYVASLLLFAYWGMCFSLGNGENMYSLQGFFGTKIDLNILGLQHVYKGEGIAFDPEGLSSTMAAIAQVIFGYLVGQYIQLKGKSFEMLSNLFIIGIAFVATGYCWDMIFPINKKIWTSSYTIYTTGLAIITIALLIFCIEFKQITGKWNKFFDVFGKNPLFIFVLSGFLPRLLGLIRINSGIVDANNHPKYITPFNWFYEHVCKNISTDLRAGSLLYALIMIAFYWSIVYILDKKKIYIKV